MLQYSNGIYEVVYTEFPKHRRYRTQLVKDSDYHTHVRTLKEAIDLANYAKHKNVPATAKIDYLHSYSRLITDNKLHAEVVELIEKKVDKKRQNKIVHQKRW